MWGRVSAWRVTSITRTEIIRHIVNYPVCVCTRAKSHRGREVYLRDEKAWVGLGVTLGIQ